ARAVPRCCARWIPSSVFREGAPMIPHCGKVLLSLVVVLAVCVVVSGCADKNKDKTGKPNNDNTDTTAGANLNKTPKQEDTRLTLANYDLIKIGMTEQEVANILGTPTQSSTTDLSGVPDLDKLSKLVDDPLNPKVKDKTDFTKSIRVKALTWRS